MCNLSFAHFCERLKRRERVKSKKMVNNDYRYKVRNRAMRTERWGALIIITVFALDSHYFFVILHHLTLILRNYE